MAFDSIEYNFHTPDARRRKDQAEKYLEEFALRLVIDQNYFKSDSCAPNFRELLFEYVYDHHCAISWYTRARFRRARLMDHGDV